MRTSMVDPSPCLSRKHVLVVDDEEDLCELIALRLEHHGFRVTTCQTLQRGLDVLATEHVDSLVLDLRLEHEHGLDLLSAAQARAICLPTVIVTADGASAPAASEMSSQVCAILFKPFETQALVAAVTSATLLPK